ncbi:alanyl-tRNA editing protein [Streptomyces sp. A 4/2]|uniref:alanine--tRNA ligase-related protein n=1 Tax=Streptomyces sp. A 4/2 TaxID=2934314 RepID=UPI00202550E2|nr:alanyl-tRNA editing protein [Streptomyces sp. A 4/2]
MRTHELHREDPYLSEFTANVTGVEDDVVELDSTAFYARGGGQVGDQGDLGGHRVVDTVVSPGRDSVLHRVEWSGEPLRVGRQVTGRIDWDRRYATMRMHSAQHLLWLALVGEYGEGQKDSGGEIRPDKARLDVVWDAAQRPAADALTARLAALTEADLPIERYVVDLAAGRWEWRVEGHAAIACGGTHVRRTGEVGRLDVSVKGKGRGTARLTVSPSGG